MLERRKQIKKGLSETLDFPTVIPTHKFHTGVRCKKIPNIQPTVLKTLLTNPSKTWLDVLGCARMVVSAATILKKNYCSLCWCVQWCRGFVQRIFSSYISATAQGRTNRIARTEKRLNLAQCPPNMYHLTHSVLANTLGYCANSPSKKFHQINHSLPSHSRPGATRFLSIEAIQ